MVPAIQRHLVVGDPRRVVLPECVFIQQIPIGGHAATVPEWMGSLGLLHQRTGFQDDILAQGWFPTEPVEMQVLKPERLIHEIRLNLVQCLPVHGKGPMTLIAIGAAEVAALCWHNRHKQAFIHHPFCML